MNLKNCIYFVPVIISLLGILTIILAVKNKDRKRNKYIIIASIINILYLFIITGFISKYIPNKYMSISTDIDFFYVKHISNVGKILYLISTIICIIKINKLNTIVKNKNIFKVFLTIILLPILFFLISLSREIYLIKNSNLILVYSSYSGGDLGRNYLNIYAVSDKYFEEITLDYLKNMTEITEKELQNLKIEVKLSDDNIYIYKNRKLKYKKKVKLKYSDVYLYKVFYNN